MRFRTIAALSIILFPVFAFQSFAQSEPKDSFDFPVPSTLGKKIMFWATNYYLHVVFGENTGPHPLLDRFGNTLGPTFSKNDWCTSALEGSARVIYSDKSVRTFNYDFTAEDDQVKCDFKNLPKTNRIRFRETLNEFGDGINGMVLFPFRTIAVAATEIPYGTTVYIPEARGQFFTLPNGEQFVHDGYFFAGDTGGAMRKDSQNPERNFHIDVFTGTDKKSPLSIVTNSPNFRKSLFIVQDESIETFFKTRHQYDPNRNDELSH